MPSRVDRTVISRGPAVVKFNGGTFFSKGDIALDWNIQNQQIASSAFGSIEPWRQKVKPTLKMDLVGQIANLPILYPHVSMTPGQSIFGNADVPLLICPIDTTQNMTTLNAAAILDQPDLMLGVEGGGPALGATTFAFVPANNSLPTDANAWFTDAANTYDGTGFDPTQILIQPYSIRYLSAGTFPLTVGANSTGALAWNILAADLATALNALASVTADGGVTVTGGIDDGWTVTAVNNNQVIAITSAGPAGMPQGTSVKVTMVQAAAAGKPQIVRISLFPFYNFPAQKAVKISLKSSVSEETADGIGVYDMLFKDLVATGTLTPMNMSEAVLDAFINVQGSSAALGSAQAALAHTLRLYAPGLYVELRNACVTKAGKVWSSEKQRVPDIEFQASRTVVAGVVQPVFYIGTVAP